MMRDRKIGVVGAGTMGRGIAEMLAKKGIEVFLKEKSEHDLNQSLELIEISLNHQMEKWAITESEKKLILSRIMQVGNLQDLSECDIVIETITEDMEAKKDLLQELDRILPNPVIIASNTSTLSLTEMASVTNREDRVIGMHFLYPVSNIDLIEIIRGVRTSDETFEEIREFVEQILEKKGIQVYESPGFVTTRLICTLINEALLTLSEGVASAEDIDSAMRIGYTFHYGPLEMADRFGLDSVLAALERMFREFGDIKYRPCYLLKKMVRAGKLGKKSGEGFFQYDKEGVRL